MNRVAAIAALTLLAVPLCAGAARAQYGALAYDSATRVWGRATNMASPRDAEATALAYCRSAGCRAVVHTGPAQCGSIAAALYGTRYHWATRPTRPEAEYVAMLGCQQDSGQPCRIVVTECNQ